MTDLITSLDHIPLWSTLAWLTIPAAIVSLAALVWLRRRLGFERLSRNNEVAGYCYGAIGTGYAMLLGFAIMITWEKFIETRKDVAREAGAVAAIFRLSAGFDPTARDDLREATRCYARGVVDDEWPAMSHGGRSTELTRKLDRIYALVMRMEPGNARESTMLGELVKQLDTLDETRRIRLDRAGGVVPGAVWFELFTAALLMVGFMLFFGSGSLRAQIAMTLVVLVMTALGLLTVIVVDRPFDGPIRVGPAPIERVLEQMG